MNIQIQGNKKELFIFRLKQLKNPFRKFFLKNFLTFPIHRIFIYQDQEHSNYIKILVEIDLDLNSEYYYNLIARKIFKQLMINFCILNHDKEDLKLLNINKFPYFFYSEFELFQFYSTIIVDLKSRVKLHKLYTEKNISGH